MAHDRKRSPLHWESGGCCGLGALQAAGIRGGRASLQGSRTLLRTTTGFSITTSVPPSAGALQTVRPDGTIGQVVAGVLLASVAVLSIALIAVVVAVAPPPGKGRVPGDEKLTCWVRFDELVLVQLTAADPAILADIEKFERLLADHLAGRLDEDAFRVFRLNNGIYGQRR